MHDWVVIGMRREVLLSLGALPQIAAGAIGMGIATIYFVISFWALSKKICNKRQVRKNQRQGSGEKLDDVIEYLLEELGHIDLSNQPPMRERTPQKGVKGPTLHFTGRGRQGEPDVDE